MNCLDYEDLERFEECRRDARARDADREVRAHLETCAKCRAMLDEVRSNADVFDDVQSELRAGATEESEGTRSDGGVPVRIGDYRVERVLGEGGMGLVYLAEQGKPKRRVAVKVLRPGTVSEARAKRFAHEAELLGRLQHPGIAQIHEAGEADVEGRDGEVYRRPFFAMEYVDGVPIDEYAEANGLGDRERLRLFVDVCDAVHHAHERGVIHRDLKPPNVLVAGGAVKVLDFGLARLAGPGSESLSELTRTGQILGTVPFMSPEQLSGDPRAVGIPSDVYALGVLLFRLLTGHLPYPAEEGTLVERARVIREQDADRMGSVERRFRGDLETIAAKALEKDPARRYANAAALAADVRRHLAREPIHARPPSTTYQVRRFAARHRALVGATVAVIAVLSVASVVSIGLAFRAARAERLAQERLASAETRQAQLEEVSGFLQRIIASANAHGGGRHDVTVREMLDGTVRELDEEPFITQPLAEAEVRTTLAHTYWSLGQYESALAQFEAALPIAAREHPPGHPDVVSLHNWLGILLGADLSRYDESETHVRAAVALAEEHFDLTDSMLSRKYLGSLQSLAGVLGDQGKYRDAEQTAMRVVTFLGAGAGLTAIAVRNNLAKLRLAQGDVAGARRAADEARERLRESGNDDHPLAVKTMHVLGVIARKEGDHDAARALAEDGLRRSEEHFGRPHPDVAAFTELRALARMDAGELEAAERDARDALAMNEELLGTTNRQTARSMRSLAAVLAARGGEREAEELLGRALRAAEAVGGPAHPEVADMLVPLSELAARRGATDEANALRERAHAIRSASLGDGNPKSLAVRGRIE